MQPKQLLRSGFAETSVVCVGLLYYRASPISTVSISMVPGLVRFVNSANFAEFLELVRFFQKRSIRKLLNQQNWKFSNEFDKIAKKNVTTQL